MYSVRSNEGGLLQKISIYRSRASLVFWTCGIPSLLSELQNFRHECEIRLCDIVYLTHACLPCQVYVLSSSSIGHYKKGCKYKYY